MAEAVKPAPDKHGRGAYALEMRGISKSFGPVKALSEVDLLVRPETVHALIGENGAGKSTLMKILSGVHRQEAGSIFRHGYEQRWTSPSQAIKAGIAMIYQELSLAPDLTVAENVFLGMEPRGRFPGTIDRKVMVEKTASLAKSYGFTLDPTKTADLLTAAECQIVEILKALARRASIIVMDEPTSSLGRDEASALLDIVRNLRQLGTTIIYISHRLEEVVEIADDITVLRDGKTVFQSEIEDLTIPKIVSHMVGRELDDFYPNRDVDIGGTRLEVRNLSTGEGVENASFEVRSGEIVGMAGLVGAGRTALARALFGIDRVIEGSIWFDGQKRFMFGPADALNARFVYVTEDRKRTGLCLDLPSSWNMTLPYLKRFSTLSFIHPKLEGSAAEKTGKKLAIKWANPEIAANALSGGNQQKLLLARALLADSQMILLDEPTRGIDIAAKADIYRLLGDLASQGKAILLISSELPELFGVADRIVVMRRGKVVGDLITHETNPEQVMQLAAVESS